LERSEDWQDVALGDLEHVKHDLESGLLQLGVFPNSAGRKEHKVAKVRTARLLPERVRARKKHRERSDKRQ